MRSIRLGQLTFALALALAARTAGAACEDALCRQTTQETQRLRAVPAAQRVGSFVRDNNLPSFTRNGRLHFATGQRTNFTNGAQSYLGQLSPNMVEFFVSPGFHHLYTRIGDKTYSRISGLSESGYYTSSSERVGVLVQLTDTEMGRLKQYVNSACRDPNRVLGPFVYGGGTPPRASNCTSWISTAKIGDRGESLARILGVWESGFPQGFVGSLARSASDRVKAVVIHNPTGTFNQSYELNLR
jgi:hypothetical protein